MSSRGVSLLLSGPFVGVEDDTRNSSWCLTLVKAAMLKSHEQNVWQSAMGVNGQC